MEFSKGLLAVVLITCALAFTFQGSRGLWEPDEGFYLNAARAMLSTGDWLVPQYNLRPFIDKPPIVYWGSAVGMDLFGVNEWGARIAHAIWYALTVWVVGLLGTSLWDKRTGLVAAFFYATCGVTMVAANIVTPDTPLTFWTTLSMYLFWEAVNSEAKPGPAMAGKEPMEEPTQRRFAWINWDSNRVLLGISLGLAVLSKGPATLIFMASMVCFLLRTGQTKRFFFRIDTLLSLILILLIGGSWYLLVFNAVPGAFSYMIDNQIVGRLFTAKYERNSSWFAFLYVYVPILFFGLLPWSISWFPLLRQNWEKIRSWRGWFSDPIDPRILFLITWSLIPFLVFSMARSRLPLYVLPLFAPLALSAARCWLVWRPRFFEPAFSPRFCVPALVWCLLLLVIKGGMAHWPTDRDTRAYWMAIRKHIPQGRFELVVVNERRHALSFYSQGNVEWVTTRDNPYPFFIAPEPIEEEIHELKTSAEHHVFLVRDKEYESILDMIRTHKAPFHEVPGPLDHHIIICDPAPPDNQVVRLVAMGDTRSGDSEQAQLGSALYHLDEDQPFDGIVLLGDNLSFDGNPRRFDEVFLKPYDALIQNGVRFFAVLGNHDITGGFSGFQMNHSLFNMGGKRYYSIPFKDNLVQVYCLDSNTICADKGQLSWLIKELDKSKALWKVVAMHHPLYGKTVKYPEPDPNLIRILEPIFIDKKVNVVLCGHNHMYQRFHPKGGVHHFTDGSGGMLDAGGILRDDPDLVFGEDTKNVALILEFTRSACEFQAVDAMETIVDSGTIPLNLDQTKVTALPGKVETQETSQ